MGGVNISGRIVVEPVLLGSLPYVIAEDAPFDPDWGYNIWRVIEGVPTRITNYEWDEPTYVNSGPEIDNLRLSPDGQWIIHAANWFNGPVPTGADNGGSGIICVDASGAGVPFLLWDDDGWGDYCMSPSWHPDSDQYLFCWGPEAVSSDVGHGGSIWIGQRTSPGTATELWRPNYILPGESPNRREGAYRPQFSPDESKIAFFVSTTAGAPGSSDYTRQGLWTMDADGSNDMLIDNWSNPDDAGGGYRYLGTQLNWSHDSEWIAYTEADANGASGGADYSLYKIRPDGSDKTLLKAATAATSSTWLYCGHGAWAADDSYVICSRLGGAIFRAEADGSGSTELISDANGTAGSYWSNCYTNHFMNRLEWISNASPPGQVSSAELDGTDIQIIHDITDDDPNEPGRPVGYQFYSGTGHEWL